MWLVIVAAQGFCFLDDNLLKISRYLFPFVLEYSLIAIGAMACILHTSIRQNEGSRGHQQVARGFKNLIRVFSHRNKMRQQAVDMNGTTIRYLFHVSLYFFAHHAKN